MPQTQYRKSYPRAQGARKPQTPQQQLQSALKRMAESRAEGADLRVIAVGKVLVTGQPVYFVPSQSVLGMWHAIVQTDKGLACDCFYSKEQHKVCVHRACVYEHLRVTRCRFHHPLRPRLNQSPRQSLNRRQNNLNP